jgi:hypothetical protein
MSGLVTVRSDRLDRFARVEALLSRTDRPAAEPDDGLKRLQANLAARRARTDAMASQDDLLSALVQKARRLEERPNA